MDNSNFGTGHDTHYLEQLTKRLGDDQQRLGLLLYRAPEIVRAIIDDAVAAGHLPQVQVQDGAARRFALALAAGDSPPHAIIAADGGFVTCLGPHMSVAGLHVVSWERLRLHLERRRRDLTNGVMFKAIEEEGDEVFHLIDLVRGGGAAVPREAMATLAALEPVLWPAFASALFLASTTVHQLGLQIGRLGRVHARDEPRLREFWNAAHAVGHFLLLTAVGGRTGFENWQVNGGEALDPFPMLHFPAMHLFHSPIMLRATWAMGASGKAGLRLLKPTAAEAEDFWGWLLPTLGIVAIGARHERLRAECVRSVSARRVPGADRESEDIQRVVGALQRALETDNDSDRLPGDVDQLREPGHGDHPFRSIAIARIGHGDRSEATLGDVRFRGSSLSSARGLLARSGVRC